MAVGTGTPLNGSGVGITQEIHPLAWLILLFGGFVVTFFGSLLVLVFYSMFFSNKYTQIRKTTGLLLLTNTILFVMMMVFFVVFQKLSGSEVVLFALYVSIAVFLSFSQIEFVVNPNYASSALSGSTIGFALALIVMGVLWLGAQASVDHSAPYMLVWMSTLIVFPLMIFGQGMRDIVYYKIYETGANPFYIPSPAELDTKTLLENQKQEAEKESVPVEI